MNTIIDWANANAGFVAIVLFVGSILAAWVSGVFRSIFKGPLKKPKFEIKILDGPTLCSTFSCDNEFNNYVTHRTAISLYVEITNIGSAAASIDKVKVGYHWNLRPFSWLWVKYRIFWFWLKDMITSMDDFQYEFEKHKKIFPHLLQMTYATNEKPKNYIEVGQKTSGVVYFEQKESWGGSFPVSHNGKVKLKICVNDTFGRSYKKVFWAPCVDVEEARKYNPSFGNTYSTVLKNKT